MPLKVVIFDAGGVLHTSTTAVQDALVKEFSLTQTALHDIWTTLIPLLGSGKITEQSFWREIHDAYGVRQVEVVENLLGKAFAETLAPYPEVLALVKALHRHGIALAVLSNTIEPHAKALREAGVYDGFDQLFLSHEVGLRKPDPAIYKHVLRELDVQPAEALFIDDDPNNVKAAQALGMQGVIFTSPAQLVADVQSLVPDLILSR